MAEMPLVDKEKCNGCGLCIKVCYCHALVMVDNVITIVEREECEWCTECEAVCPTGAISCPFEIVIEEH
ncbi:MAG TPA: 4Fe-4S binding protein [Dehalococcoidales bacterium]|nr:4Fe-4S binding protein [Dehalococcoidales bacterium]